MPSRSIEGYAESRSCSGKSLVGGVKPQQFRANSIPLRKPPTPPSHLLRRELQSGQAIMHWNQNDPRAVVPPASLHESRDVVSSTSAHAAASPYPLGFGIYTCPEDKSADKKPLPMLYVSQAVARDRSPENPRNPGGVVPGWYVVARPSTQFELRVTKINQRSPGGSRENRLNTDVYVDGQNVHHSMGFGRDEEKGSEHVATGFVEKCKEKSSGEMVRTVREFAFQKATVTEEADSDFMQSEAGSIRLCVRIGQGVRRMNTHGRNSVYTYNRDKKVSEKEVAKLGRSLKVCCDGKLAKRKRFRSSYSMVSCRDLSEANVTVLVREAQWMKLRRLIDNKGMPCTYEMYTKLLSGHSERIETEGDDVKLEVQVVRHPDMMVRRQIRVVVGVDDVEVIDLT